MKVKAILNRDVTGFATSSEDDSVVMVTRTVPMPKGTVVEVYGGQTFQRAGDRHVAVRHEDEQRVWVPWSALAFISMSGGVR